VTAPDTATEVLGVPLSMPVMIAPWAYQRLIHPDGEHATARAAARAGTLMVVSTPAERHLETIAATSDAPRWFQLYVLRDRGASEEMLHRAVDAGYRAVVFTVDLTVGGLRHRDARNGFQIPIEMRAHGGDYDLAITWDDIGWIKEHTGLPVVVKGIVNPEDVPLALAAGADGIVVSNHGGRQLDGTPASVEALPDVVEAVTGRIPVLLDGGVRRGTDVVKAIALGAEAVLVGKAAAWGLAAEGEGGVIRVLEILRAELENAMILAGCRTIADITSDLVARA
jgi:4-hydroxymandelate oxidase